MLVAKKAIRDPFLQLALTKAGMVSCKILMLCGRCEAPIRSDDCDETNVVRVKLAGVFRGKLSTHQ